MELVRAWVDRGCAAARAAGPPDTLRRLLSLGATVANLRGDGGDNLYSSELRRLEQDGRRPRRRPAEGARRPPGVRARRQLRNLRPGRLPLHRGVGGGGQPLRDPAHLGRRRPAGARPVPRLAEPRRSRAPSSSPCGPGCASPTARRPTPRRWSPALERIGRRRPILPPALCAVRGIEALRQGDATARRPQDRRRATTAATKPCVSSSPRSCRSSRRCSPTCAPRSPASGGRRPAAAAPGASCRGPDRHRPVPLPRAARRPPHPRAQPAVARPSALRRPARVPLLPPSRARSPRPSKARRWRSPTTWRPRISTSWCARPAGTPRWSRPPNATSTGPSSASRARSAAIPPCAAPCSGCCGRPTWCGAPSAASRCRPPAWCRPACSATTPAGAPSSSTWTRRRRCSPRRGSRPRSCSRWRSIRCSATASPPSCQALREEWAPLGVELEVVIDSYPGLRRHLGPSLSRPPELDLMIGRWAAAYDDPDNFTYNLFHSRTGLLRGFFRRRRPTPCSRRRAARPGRPPAPPSTSASRIWWPRKARSCRFSTRSTTGWRSRSGAASTLRNTPPYLGYAEIGRGAAAACGRPPAVAPAGRRDPRADSAAAALARAGLTNLVSHHEVVSAIFETLTRLDEQARIRPWLAESVEAQQGGRAFRFRLRRGLRFHDGRRLTSRDVRYSFERLLQTPSNELHFLLLPIQGARALAEGETASLQGFRILSPRDFLIELHRPLAFFRPSSPIPAPPSCPKTPAPSPAAGATGCAAAVLFRVAALRAGPAARPRAQSRPTGGPASPRPTAWFSTSSPRRPRFSKPFQARPPLARRRPPAAGRREPAALARVPRRLPGIAQPLDLLPGRQRAQRAAGRPRPPHRAFRGARGGRADPRPARPAGDPRPRHRAARPRRLRSAARPAAAAGGRPRRPRRPARAAPAARHPPGFRRPLRRLPRSPEWPSSRSWASTSSGSKATSPSCRGSAAPAAPTWCCRAGWRSIPDTDCFLLGLLDSREGVIAGMCASPEIDRLIEKGRLEADPGARATPSTAGSRSWSAHDHLLLPLFHAQTYRFAQPGVRGLKLGITVPEVRYEELYVDGGSTRRGPQGAARRARRHDADPGGRRRRRAGRRGGRGARRPVLRGRPGGRRRHARPSWPRSTSTTWWCSTGPCRTAPAGSSCSAAGGKPASRPRC